MPHNYFAYGGLPRSSAEETPCNLRGGHCFLPDVVQLADFQPAAFGIPNDMVGLLINTITPKPTRTKVAKANHLGFEGIIDIFKNPQYALEVDAEDYMTNGKLNNRQPGEAISRADVANYFPT
jgi:hypothetical protein